MSEEKSEVRFKIGQMEVEFQGSESFMKESLPELIANVLEQHEAHKDKIPAEPEELSRSIVQQNSANGLDHSTNTIATLTNANSGSDLVIAAVACLTLAKAKDRMTRSEILGEMQSATSFYKISYRSNLSNYLDGLVKADRLRLHDKDLYALSAAEKKSLEITLDAGH